MRKILSFFIVAILMFFANTAHAALAAYSGSFLTGTSTGNASVTGVGFTPKVILFYGAAKPDSQGQYNNARMGLGAATSSSNRWANSVVYNWSSAAGTSQAARQLSTTKCFSFVGAASSTTQSTLMDADFVSMDADGFTYNLTTTDGTARRVFFVALGGSDLSVNVGTFDIGTGTGSVSVTGVGFQSDIVMMSSSISSTSAGSFSNATWTFGAAISSSSQFSSGWFASTSVNPTNTKAYQIGTKVIGRMGTAGTVSMEAGFTSMDSDGFTINVTTADALARKIGYVALDGIQAKIGTITQKTSIGTTATTGVGFTPKLLILSSVNSTSSASAVAGGPTLGTATGVSNRSVVANDSLDANSGNHAQGNTSTALVMGHYRATGTTADSTHPTTLGEADLSSFDADGFTLNWTATDGNARESYYIAIGQSNTASSGSTGVMYLF